jgi:hypothetical protein
VPHGHVGPYPAAALAAWQPSPACSHPIPSQLHPSSIPAAHPCSALTACAVPPPPPAAYEAFRLFHKAPDVDNGGRPVLNSPSPSSSSLSSPPRPVQCMHSQSCALGPSVPLSLPACPVFPVCCSSAVPSFAFTHFSNTTTRPQVRPPQAPSLPLQATLAAQPEPQQPTCTLPSALESATRFIIIIVAVVVVIAAPAAALAQACHSFPPVPAHETLSLCRSLTPAHRLPLVTSVTLARRLDVWTRH